MEKNRIFDTVDNVKTKFDFIRSVMSIMRCVFVVMIGIAFLISGVGVTSEVTKYNQKGKGVITDIRTSDDNKEIIVFEYDIDGQHYSTTETISATDEYEVGDEMEFVYKKGSPSSITETNSLAAQIIKYIGPGMIVIGVLLIVFGAIRLKNSVVILLSDVFYGDGDQPEYED